MFLERAILLQWAGIFIPTGRNTFWWTCHVTLWVNVLFYFICTFIEIFGCSPREKLWRSWVEGHGIDVIRPNIAFSFINFASDVVILILPQTVIWRLQISRTRKVGTATLFTLGICESPSLFRRKTQSQNTTDFTSLSATIAAGVGIKASFLFADDPAKACNVCELGLWCYAEMGAGFFIVCLPALPKPFRGSPWIQTILVTLRSFTSSTRS